MDRRDIGKVLETCEFFKGLDESNIDRIAGLCQVETYKPGHLKRIANKPGITGLWQVSGRNKITEFEQVVVLDCQYFTIRRPLEVINRKVQAVNENFCFKQLRIS